MSTLKLVVLNGTPEEILAKKREVYKEYEVHGVSLKEALTAAGFHNLLGANKPWTEYDCNNSVCDLTLAVVRALHKKFNMELNWPTNIKRTAKFVSVEFCVAAFPEEFKKEWLAQLSNVIIPHHKTNPWR